MNQFFKRISSTSSTTNMDFASNRDELIKKSILNQLTGSIKEIQYYCGGSGSDSDDMFRLNTTNNNTVDNINEATNSLCVGVEALFLHGLKDSIIKRFRRVIVSEIGVDSEQRLPQPSFWPTILIISHRQIIDQITSLAQITTEIGQCRSWIRLVLNDSQLSSYLTAIRQDRSAIKPYYKTSAFLFDADLLDIVQRLIESVEQFTTTFSLPSNSSLLNQWQSPSLYLAGIVFATTLKANNVCQLAACDDVVVALSNSTHQTTNSENWSLNSGATSDDTNSMISVGGGGASLLRHMTTLNEDEVLKMILAKSLTQPSNHHHQQSSSSDRDYNSKSENETTTTTTTTDSDSISDGNNAVIIGGNSLNNVKTGWSFDDDDDHGNDKELIKKSQLKNEQLPKSMEDSFNTLLENYSNMVINNNDGGSLVKTPDLRQVLLNFDEQSSTTANIINDDGNNQSYINNNLNEGLEGNVSSSKHDSQSLTVLLSKICQEKGLDAQNYQCASCNQPLGMNHKLNVCGFTGDYICDSCVSIEPSPIPARIIHNWDFKSYPVSLKAYEFLNEIKDDPIIDLKRMNPFIYGMVDELVQLQLLRIQLNFLRAYLYTCREPIIEEFQKQMWPKEYMYEHIHQYTVADLVDIQSGHLVQQLEAAVEFGRKHVVDCWLCGQKGFVCEICNKPKALFPFDVHNVYRCDLCNGVYHLNCLDATQPCPKCERRKKREDRPLLGATV